LVDTNDIITALGEGKVASYVTDFGCEALLDADGAIVIPHLGASTPESEDNCAEMAVKELKNYLQNGNIKNSVNYPDCDMGVCTSTGRIAINHRNIPNMIAQLTKVLGDEGINITVFANKCRGEYAYSLIDTETEIPEMAVEDILKIKGVLKVRVIK
jgi:D-3-phosphoglycerate dehydrogenase